MKLYTRTGDDGSTGLFGGGRVGKDHPRVKAYGAVDETNAALGLCVAACAAEDDSEVVARLRSMLIGLQSRLFDLGADLATPIGGKHEDRIARMSAADVVEAEAMIDEVDGGNEPMRSFVLPGGTELAARLHLARGLCRRAERAMVALSRVERVTPEAVVYINRVSDLLFAMARRANAAAGVPDIKWTPKMDNQTR